MRYSHQPTQPVRFSILESYQYWCKILGFACLLLTLSLQPLLIKWSFSQATWELGVFTLLLIEVLLAIIITLAFVMAAACKELLQTNAQLEAEQKSLHTNPAFLSAIAKHIEANIRHELHQGRAFNTYVQQLRTDHVDPDHADGADGKVIPFPSSHQP